MTQKHTHLLVADFDGTVAATFADSPNGINVNVASDYAVSAVFGDNGMAAYHRIGGLQNREPGELVRLIGQSLEPVYGMEPVEVLTERYIQAKLDLLLPEISTDWPKLYPGVRELFQGAAEGRIPVNTGIASSGHDAFIRKVFSVNGLPPPEILVTSDLLRIRSLPKRQRYKPFTYQLAEVHRQWLHLGVDDRTIHYDTQEGYTGRDQGKPYIAYVGDDPPKDGGLALQARIPYIHVPFTKPGYVPREDLGQMRVDSFFDLAELLQNHAGELASGIPFSSILLGKADPEIFPPQTEDQFPFARWLREATARGSHRERMF
jgi:hypothetical protein